jgi:DNA helicase-2/ATP-dependent DNA helicase PcrA
VVGDLSQAIYTWRGGRPELLAGFAKKWDARTIVMHRNYRCGQANIDAGNAVIRPAVMRVEADMTAERGVPGEVRISGVGTYDDEGEQIATEIATEIANGDATPSDYFVLYRVNAQSRAIEERLLRKKVPYVILGGTSFYDRREVKDLLAYLRVASGDGELDDVKRCVNSPFRFLGAKFVERLIAAAERVGVNRVDWSSVVRSVGQEQGLQSRQRASASDWAELIDQCGREIENGTRPARILDDVIRVTKYMEYVRAEDGEETVENSSEANVREMVRVAEQFATARELLNHIEQTHRDAARASRVKGERVVLMTVHRSKGLEAKHVYVVGLNEGTMPHGRGDPEEERRLAYVAFTRARDVLSLSYVRSFATKGGVKEAKPSRFLADAGLLATVESESIPLCK